MFDTLAEWTRETHGQHAGWVLFLFALPGICTVVLFGFLVSGDTFVREFQ